MDKKKALKIATATTVAASAFVSVAPATFAASTSTASKAVTKAEADAKKVKDQYNAKKLAFKKIDTKAAVSSYNKAVAEVKKLSKGKTKSALESKLKAVKGIHTYAANYNKALDLGAALATATKNVNDELKKASFDLAGAKKDQAALKTATTNFSKHVVKGTVYGESPRAQFTAKYLTPAKTAATAVDKKIKAVEAELSDVRIATADVVALESAVKGLKDEATVATAENLLTAAKASFAKVDTASVKTDLSKRISAAEKTLGDFKTEWNEVKTATADVVKLEEAVKALKDDATVKAAEDALATAKASYTKVDTESAKADLGKRIEDAGKAIEAKKAELAVPKVESVSAINTKTVEVKFDKALTADEQSKVTYEVKVNGTVAPFKVESAAGTSVKLVRTSGLVLEAGSYEVTVKGLKEDQAKTFTVEAQKAASLAVKTTNVVDNANASSVALELKDQYGEALTINEADYNVTAYNVTQSHAIELGFDSTNKVFTIDSDNDADDFKVGDVVKVSFLHKATGLSTSKELTVVAGSQLSSLTFGSTELPTGKTLLTEDLEGVKVAYNAADQYGNSLTLSSDNIAVVSSDENIIASDDVTFISEGTPAVKKVRISGFGGYGKVTLSFVNKVTGDVYRLPLEVKQQAGVISKVSLDQSSLEVAQGGSGAVAMNVTDNYGTAIEAKNYVNAPAFTISSTNNSVATAQIENDANEDNYGKLVVSTHGTKGQKAVITVTVNSTGETFKLNVTIGEPAVASSIRVHADSEHSTSLAVGAATTVDFEVLDQYANAVGNADDYKVVYSVKDANEAITLTGADEDGVVEDASEAATSVEVNAAKAGTATLVAKLVKGDSEVIATKEVSFNVVANASDKLTYSIADIPTLYKAGSGDDAVIDPSDISAGYAKEVKLTAKDATGNTVSIPANKIVDVTTTSDKVVIENVAGKYYVAGNATLSENATATISVIYNAEDGVKTLTKQVTVSSQALTASKIHVLDKVYTDSTAKELSTINVADFTALDAKEAYIYVEDQFGGFVVPGLDDPANTYDDIKLTISNKMDYTDTSGDDVVTVAGGKLDFANFTGNSIAATKSAGTFRVIATSKSGASTFLNVKVGN
ncbi:hypothetical protein [Fictibacillus sp. KU28468]|uniref:hypothetical protein n=1 Tax=Fictibacillus sp. KU28468 TaxID=2991053 RepID=UPI00223D9438|nr:hypothetical protein [Fictibacillus sp. KU28468]UZJ79562.1 hypothetical protein OKX00_03500 [Fictibacillus sp. KU28468]